MSTRRRFCGASWPECETPIRPGSGHLVQDSGFVTLAKRAFVFDEQVEEAMASMLGFACSAGEFQTFGAWLDQMAHRDADVRRGRSKGGQILRLFSIPAAKGLEFDHVVIPDVGADSFDGRQQEERNLFYVGHLARQTKADDDLHGSAEQLPEFVRAGGRLGSTRLGPASTSETRTPSRSCCGSPRWHGRCVGLKIAGCFPTQP